MPYVFMVLEVEEPHALCMATFSLVMSEHVTKTSSTLPLVMLPCLRTFTLGVGS